jgi:hypothetical protein
MLKSKLNIILILALVLVLALSAAGAALAAKPEQSTVPTLKLTVTKSPLTIYPPIMIYTAQLSPAPTSSSTVLTVDFYNQIGGQMPPIQYLGSAPMDKTGKAVLNKQMLPGTYTAFCQVVIGTQTIVSNKVLYKVP